MAAVLNFCAFFYLNPTRWGPFMNYVHHEKGKGYARLMVLNLGDIAPPQ